MGSDLQQNIFVTLYLLFSHNYIAIVYFLGVLLAVVFSIMRPSRFSVLILIGFIVLLFSFEYDKHIIVGFREQTLKSLITIEPHFRLQHLINVLISEILPVLFYVTGWLLIFIAIIYAALTLGKHKKA